MGLKDPKKGGVYIDCWHIPGGKIEKKETLIDALNREVLEETGIDISKYETKLVDDKNTGESIKNENGKLTNIKMHFNVYKVIIKDKTAQQININLDDDLFKYKWFNSKELKKVKLTPPSIKLFKKLKLI